MNEKILTDFDKTELLLKEYAMLDIDIKGKDCEIKLEGLKAISYNDLPSSPLPSQLSPVEQQLKHIDDLKNEKLALEIKKEAIENIFKVLTDLERKFIKHKYVEELSYKEIGKKLNMSGEYLVEKRKKIIKKLIPYAKRYNLLKN